MKKIIKKILKEDQRERYLNKIINFMKNDYPLFHNLKDYGFYDQLSWDELYYVLSGILEQPVFRTTNRSNSLHVYDGNGNKIYYENYHSFYWYKTEYNDNGNTIYYENSDGFWWKREYRYKTNIVSYYEDSNGVIKGKQFINEKDN
jgi:hypothetical protein